MSESLPPLQVDLSQSVRAWMPPKRAVTRWARVACGARGRGHELAVHVVSRRQSQALNRQFRSKDQPTNVLSFGSPAPSGALLGDLVVCAAVLRKEANEQRKPLLDHWAHMVVHGCLHLLGLDHERPTEARRMERREVAILSGLGVADPYLQQAPGKPKAKRP